MMTDPFLEATYHAERRHFWFRGLAWFTEPLIARAVAGVSRPEILDCGCGTGANMQRLSRYGRVAGFDMSWGGLQFARRYQQSRVAQASITSIPFATGRFDLVTVFDVFACLDYEQEQTALADIRRVLRPGGALLVNTAAFEFLRGRHAVFGHEVKRPTRALLKRALERAGFEVQRLTYTNFSLLPVLVPVRLMERAFGLASAEERAGDLRVPPAPVNAALTALLAAESAALRHMNMPLGSSLLALARKP